MAIEIRDFLDPDGRRWLELLRDGTLISRKPREQQFQPPKVVMELALKERFEDWRRWRLTREEATARGVSAVVITALTARENASWATYLAALNEWRLAD